MNKHDFMRKYLESGGWFQINAQGNSMYPFYRSGIDLLIEMASINEGCCVLAFNEIYGYRVHRVIEIAPDGKYRLKGDAIGVLEREMITIDNIIGVVVGFYKHKKMYCYKKDAIIYRKYSKLMAKFSLLHAKRMSKFKQVSNKGMMFKIAVNAYKVLYMLVMYVFGFCINHFMVRKGEIPTSNMFP